LLAASLVDHPQHLEETKHRSGDWWIANVIISELYVGFLFQERNSTVIEKFCKSGKKETPPAFLLDPPCPPSQATMPF
jgi:hypothetical protein